jgi:hypothetical protein
MRVYGPNGAAVLTGTRPGRRSAAATFELADGLPSQSASASTGVRTVGGIDALLALQGEQEPAERRRQAIKRGRMALDALEQIKLDLLDGTLNQSAVTRLRLVAAELRAGSGDPRLDHVLGEIELRVAVELAKFDSARRREIPKIA